MPKRDLPPPQFGMAAEPVKASKIGEAAKTAPTKAKKYNPIHHLGDYAHPPKKGKKK
jgi:hypothetical protein